MFDTNGAATFPAAHKLALELRRQTLITSSERRLPHLGSCLSCADILAYIYSSFLDLDKIKNLSPDRDKFVLSKGHAAPILFQVLAETRLIDPALRQSFGMDGSPFHEHPPAPYLVPGIEAATGSLGQGFPMAAGFALASKIRGYRSKIVALLGDGELNEGSIWETAMFASSQKLDNLICIIDFNKLQATGRSTDILHLSYLVQKWTSFGWHAEEIPGHDLHQIDSAFQRALSSFDKPSMIIAHTVKGKGVSFMEDDNNWHYKTPSAEELKLALQELN